MAFSVGVSDHVMIAHSFADPFIGPTQQLHGATYSVESEVTAPKLRPHHVVMDIGALRTILRVALAAIDDSNLDQHPAFPNRTSTTERVAEHLPGEHARRIATLESSARPVAPAALRVVLRESPVAWASFTREV